MMLMNIKIFGILRRVDRKTYGRFGEVSCCHFRVRV